MLNGIAKFVDENPLWFEDDDATTRLVMAYGILRQISTPDEVTQEEFEFVMNFHSTLTERNEQ